MFCALEARADNQLARFVVQTDRRNFGKGKSSRKSRRFAFRIQHNDYVTPLVAGDIFHR